MIRDTILEELVKQQTSYFNNQMVSEQERVAIFKKIQARQKELAKSE